MVDASGVAMQSTKKAVEDMTSDGYSIFDSYILKAREVRSRRSYRFIEYYLVPPPRLLLKNRKRWKV